MQHPPGARTPGGAPGGHDLLRLLQLSHALLELSVSPNAADKLEHLIDEDDGHGECEYEDPIVVREGHDGEDGGEKGHVEDDEVEAKGDEHGQQEPGIAPRRHLQQGAILRECVKRVEHLNGHEHRQGEGGGLHLAIREVQARLRGQVDAAEGGRLEVSPRGALSPVRELVKGDKGVTILGPVIVEIPIHKDAHCGESHVRAHHHVPEEDPGCYELVVARARRLAHDVLVRRVEAKGGGWGAIGDEVDPEQLHRDHAFGNAEECSDEDGGHLPNVGGNEVADEGLHVGVDRTALLHGRDDGGKVVVGEHHVSGLLGHLRARNAHGDADGGLLESWCVVDAVACHGGHLPLLAEHAHELLLVAGLGAREDAAPTALHEQTPPVLG
mmetsp:Transcript_9814/g.26682  ORF Transcript_9814/g.26682 Transcript_9814/m.26682 type:complete len:384 (+) Transcript_9814:266-1417(+)